MATIVQPPFACNPSPKSARPRTPGSTTPRGGSSTPAKAATPKAPRSPASQSNVERWPVNPVPRSNDASVAHCVLRMDSVPVRCIAADKTSIYLAEAPLRGSSSGGHGGHGGRLTARDPRTGKISRTLSGGGVTLSCIMVANDGHLWSGTFDGLIRVSRRGGQALHETRAHASSVHSLAEAVEAVFSAGGDFVVRAWSPSLTPLRTLRAHTASVHALAAPIPSPGTYGYHGEAFSAGGAGIWSGGDDHAVHVWSGSEASGFEHVATIDDFGAPVRVLVPQNASPPRVWAADAAGALRVYDARSRSVLRTCQSASSGVPPTTCVACTPRAVWVGDASGGITIYDGTSLARLQFLEAVHSGVVHGLACAVTLGPGRQTAPWRTLPSRPVESSCGASAPTARCVVGACRRGCRIGSSTRARRSSSIPRYR